MKRNLLVLTSLVGFAFGACAVVSLAQVPATKVTPATAKAGGKVEAAPDGPPGVDGAKGKASGPKAEPAATGPKEPPKPSPRLEKLKQLQVDRRPSAILKAWAPPKKDDKPPAQPKNPKEAALDQELADFTRAIVLSQWGKVKDYLAKLPDEEAAVAYKQILQQLQQNRMPNMDGLDPEMQMRMQQMMGGMQQYAERNAFTLDDLFGLAAACPTASAPAYFNPRSALYGTAVPVAKAPQGIVDREHLPTFANIFRDVLQNGTLIEVAVERLKAEAAKGTPLTKRQLAKILTLANQAAYSGDFLPTFEEAQQAKDLEGLNLLSRHYIALHGREAKVGNLERAWQAVQTTLAFPDGKREDQEEALVRAVELAPKVSKELGQAWLDESFTKKMDRGMDIIATVGSLVASGMTTKPFQTEERLNALKLMKTAVEAMLKAAPDRAAAWRPTLTLLAAAWLKEAEFSREHDRNAGSGPRLRMDPYGNIFYSNDDEGPYNPYMMMNRGNQPQPVPVADILRARPSDEWVAAVDPGFRPKLAGLLAQLHLKANEEDKAFPLIEQIAPAQKDEAKSLVREFLRVWTRNHDPNESRNRYRYTWYFYGFDNRAESIPLTRSKQERNLAELAGWVARIKKLPIGDLDDELFVRAFTNCHSSAEVYKTEAIEKVFGPLGSLRPRTLAGLAQQMRANLAGLWRIPAEQDKAKTKRKKQDIQAEVLAGYEVARKTIEDGLTKFPNHWALLAAKASLIHDEINYRQELAKSADFATNRAKAFDLYEQAAGEYAKEAGKLPEDERTNLVFEHWFYASLGAVDIGAITEEKQSAVKEPEKIRKAILALPGIVAEKSMDRFANDLFTRMSGAKPHLKFRYLKAGFEIVGDHKQAVEAKKVFDYYKDLVQELKLDVLVDGSPRLAAGKPFGIFVNLRHTRDIERESGGFGRYLQNQNSSGYFSYNYGRPTADYKDRFEQAAKEALKEHFEVVSVTFQDEKVHSRALPEYGIGWRYTPYAYILLKPRGPQVDKVPPLRIDLDFLDTSGYAVLPIESPAVPIDCKGKAEPRPLDKLSVTQILDERQADKGVLILEIKAVGVGLVPELEDLATVDSPGFEVSKTDDQGVAVKKFEDDADQNGVVTERIWTITFKGKDGQTELPKTFQFASVKLPTKPTDGLVYQRYNDADLATVEPVVSLEQKYGQTSNAGLYAAIGGGLLTVMLGGMVAILFLRKRKPVVEGVALPADLNAFSVLEILQRMQTSGDLSPGQREELNQAIAGIERYYFSADRNGDPEPDLRRIATRWVTV